MLQQQKFLKRPAEEHDPGGSSENYEPPVKLQCTTQQHGSHPNEGLTKFSVEIVQQLEFTTSAANSQPQQISTNVTVKAHTNASVKSDVSSPKSNPSTPASNLQQKSNIGLDVGTLVECVKQEPDNDFADLDQCAAALEKDAAANGGAAFGGFSDLIGEDTNDEIITSDAFNDLISDISNYPELMKDFDFEDKTEMNAGVNGLKVEDMKDLQQPVSEGAKSTHSPLLPNQTYSPPVFDGQGGMPKGRMAPYSNMDFCKTELSPAAQTLKQMAEQHQHKNQIGMSFNPNARAPNSRSPYPDFQFQGDYGSPNSNPNFHKNSPNFSQPDMIKQEMIFQGNDFDMKRKSAGIYKQQQYSPYSSPSASSHGSPGYLPRSGTGSTSGPAGGAFGGGTPPRPPSGPGGNNSGATLQINQAQQLHISQQNHGHAIQI
ncbi:neurogenic protein mastermind-like [Asbolus verrucosus]|uniref:Neurogenic protein mastermind-like n=1 Tax=Asbolus verrucosus TaxID=1661398 RepID=A0A482W307_ASBVE|nr:neurogenic protein mastermind-like [Asbolus verrucosus]